MTKFLPEYDIVKSEIYLADNELVTTYGICSTNLKNNILIKDISTDIEKARHFVNLCNVHRVSLLNLEDVLEDFIS